MKKIVVLLGAFLLIAFAFFRITLYPKLNIVNGFSARSVATHYFLAGRSQEFTEKTDNDIESMDLATSILDKNTKTVESSVYGLKKRKAIYKDGIGTILIPENEDASKIFLVPNRDKTPKNMPFPYGDLPQKDTVFTNIDYLNLDKAISNAFTEDADIKKTRSVLVVYKNQIIGEQYKEPFDKNSIFLGWSMAKSITSGVLGVLEQQGKIKIDQSNLFEEWKNDDRKNITIRNLLNMNSGLEWEEDYTKICDATEMLFIDSDMSLRQKNKQLVGKPNESWNYSSGTSNLLSAFIRKQFSSQQAYLDFWYTNLIDKIGMHSALIETDYSGNYIGSSYVWATARDWAKFGLLYLHNGNWNGEQIIHKHWVEFTQKPTNTSKGEYGGHFWTNEGLRFKSAPKNMYYCDGYQGQFVCIFPDLDLVIVRTGLDGSDAHIDALLKDILANIK